MSTTNTKKRSIDEIDGDIVEPPSAKKQKLENNTEPKSSNNFISSAMHPDLRKELEAIVKECMQSFDASHDFYHVERVRNLALQIAVKEGVKDLELVELTALLHDINDHKYIEKNNNDNNNNNDRIKQILNRYNISSEKQEKMSLIINNMSFSKEIKVKNAENKEEYSKYLSLIKSNPELACIQDADRLDAIGAIGIGRTFCFGGAKSDRSLFNYPLHENTENNNIYEWIQNKQCNKTTIGHFYDKLLLLKDMMKTKTGQEMAQKKHEIMQLFLDSFLSEWQGNL